MKGNNVSSTSCIVVDAISLTKISDFLSDFDKDKVNDWPSWSSKFASTFSETRPFWEINKKILHTTLIQLISYLYGTLSFYNF